LFTYEESIQFIAIFSHKYFQVAQWLPVSASTATSSSEAVPFSKDFGNDITTWREIKCYAPLAAIN
jgi:hypothetical protein